MKLENEYTTFSHHADKHGYVVAYPQATGFEVNGMLITSWNDLGCNASPGPEGPICTDKAFDYPTPPECGGPSECGWCSCYDDVGFIAALLDELEASLCVDLDRVFATGISSQDPSPGARATEDRRAIGEGQCAGLSWASPINGTLRWLDFGHEERVRGREHSPAGVEVSAGSSSGWRLS